LIRHSCDDGGADDIEHVIRGHVLAMARRLIDYSSISDPKNLEEHVLPLGVDMNSIIGKQTEPFLCTRM
jgi:hypothetical protein